MSENYKSQEFEMSKNEIAKIERRIFVRKLPHEYEELITKSDPIISIGSEFSSSIFDYYDPSRPSEAMEIIRKKMKDETVLDVGCGEMPHSPRVFARKNGAFQYIGVDKKGPYDFQRLDKETPSLSSLEFILPDADVSYEAKQEEKVMKNTDPEIVVARNDGQMEAILINGDILSVISRLNDNSINVIIFSGIECQASEFWSVARELNDKYWKAMKLELFRILKRGGIIIVYGAVSPILTGELKRIARFGDFHMEYEGVYEKQMNVLE